jgi:PilZ domain
VNTHQKASSATNIVSSNPEELNRACLVSFRRTRTSRTRRFDRYRTELPLVVKVLGRHGYVRVHGRCFELAEAGLGAVTTSVLAVGEMVSLELSIPDMPEPIAVRAVVRHRMGFLHGCEFVGLLPEQLECIRDFCQDLQPA